METRQIAPTSKLAFTLILVLFLCAPATALAPEIYSVKPDHGTNDAPTEITILGNNFEATPRVALYRGGPDIVGSADAQSSAEGVQVSGNYAYVADGSAGLQVIDITDPTNPAVVGSADTKGYARDVYVLGNYAYLANDMIEYESEYGGLRIIDITDPTNPTVVGSADTSSYANGVHVSGNYAYVADTTSGLQVVDITDPTNPAVVGSADTPGMTWDVYVSGNYAYVGDGYAGLQVLTKFEPCTNTAFIDSTTLTATVPVGLPPGTYNLHVTNPNPEWAILYNAFTVTSGESDNDGDFRYVGSGETG